MNNKYQSVFHRVDETVLTMLAKRTKNVRVTIYTARISKKLTLDLQKLTRPVFDY